MSREKDQPKHDDPEQSKRFVDTAREIGVDETEKGADRAFKRVTKPLRDRDPAKPTRGC